MIHSSVALWFPKTTLFPTPPTSYTATTETLTLHGKIITEEIYGIGVINSTASESSQTYGILQNMLQYTKHLCAVLTFLLNNSSA